MDRKLIEDKLESLRRCVRRVQDRTPAAADQLASDADLQDIVALNLTRAVQLSVDIAIQLLAESETRAPQTMGESFDGLSRSGVIDSHLAERMKRAVGFRNIVVHDYRAIDWAIVYSICTRDLDDFKSFARAVMNYVENGE